MTTPTEALATALALTTEDDFRKDARRALNNLRAAGWALVNVERQPRTLRERLAALEHDQWVAWSKDVASKERLTLVRQDRWRSLWVPYDQLTEEQKDQDRIWADKVLAEAEAAAPQPGERACAGCGQPIPTGWTVHQQPTGARGDAAVIVHDVPDAPALRDALMALAEWAHEVARMSAVLRVEPPYTSTRRLGDMIADANLALAHEAEAEAGEPGTGDRERVKAALHEAVHPRMLPSLDGSPCSVCEPWVDSFMAALAHQQPTEDRCAACGHLLTTSHGDLATCLDCPWCAAEAPR